jgi:predicted ATPase
MAFPGACLYELDDDGVRLTKYDDLAVVQLWRRFLDHPDSVLRHLLEDE